MSIIISEIRIVNFRSLRNVRVKLSPNITLLVGANNSGKTTFLRALNIALNTEEKFISQDDLFINKDGKPLPEGERIIIIDVKIVPAGHAIRFDEKWIYDWTKVFQDRTTGADFFAFRTELDFTETIHSAQINRYYIVDWENEIANKNDEDKFISDLSNIPFYHIDAQRDLYEETTKRTSDFGKLAGTVEYDEETQKELEEQLAILNEQAVKDSPVLENLKENLKSLNKTVQNKGAGVEITPFPKRVRDLSKGMKVHFQDGESDSFGLEYHGMGTRSWASLLTFKAMIEQEAIKKEDDNKLFHPSLGLEEPEAHLHPNAQRQVYKQLSEIKGQKIISTHSPYIVTQADLSELRHFGKDRDETCIKSIDVKKLNTDEDRKIRREVLPTGDILFSKAIVLFEGETEAQSFPVFARKYWDAEPFETGITFIKVNGNNYKPFLLLAKAMQISWFIFSDYDKKNIKNGIDNALELIGFDKTISHPNVIKLGKPIEEYLIEEGYQDELKAGIKNWYLTTISEDTHPKQIDAGQKHVSNYDDPKLLADIASDNGKVRYPVYWANEIILRSGNKCIPLKVRQLFDAIENILKINNQESSNAKS